MIIAVSPYHLTTREPAALAAMLLAERVVTMLPAPLQGKQWGAVRQAAERVPRYLEFMKTWSWTMPLWESGVITSSLEGQEAVDELRPVCARIDEEERLAPLRLLMKPELFEDHERYLDAFALDLLKAGPDPGLTVPVASGLDSFASRHGAAVARSQPASVVQKAEAALGREVFSVAMPVLLQADSERILEARELLQDELDALRESLSAIVDGTGQNGSGASHLAAAAKAYSKAFETNREILVAPSEDDEQRVIDGTVVITGLRLPADAVLDSSLSAMRALSPALGSRAVSNGSAASHAIQRQGVLSLMVRVLGRPARR